MKCLSCLSSYEADKTGDRKCYCDRESDKFRRSLLGRGCPVHRYKIGCKYAKHLCEDKTWRYEGDINELCLKCLNK